MTGQIWLVAVLAVGPVAGAVWWLVADWRRDIRQARTAGRIAQAVIADMGKHNVPAADERTDPKFAQARGMLPIGDGPPRRRGSLPVRDLLARVAREGSPPRLNRRNADEQRAPGGDRMWSADDFPTAVLPAIRAEEPNPGTNRPT
jgi:hypothetical protein